MPTSNILSKIAIQKRKEIALLKKDGKLTWYQNERLAGKPRGEMFYQSLKKEGISFIAELKKASPSAGILRKDFHPLSLAVDYQAGGADALSVLTDETFFQGDLSYLIQLRKADLGLPLLRKDFILDPIQVYESAYYGADAILLIAALLEVEKLQELFYLAHDLGLACLLEVHNKEELIKVLALEDSQKIIGINNRDLTTFKVSLGHTEVLKRKIPASDLVVSESGIKDREDISRLEHMGVDAVLIGTSLVKNTSPKKKLLELRGCNGN